jgi:S1-C subfamily serine protease
LGQQAGLCVCQEPCTAHRRKEESMHTGSCRLFCLIVILFITVNAHAKNASEVFEVASKSIVVVLGYDSKERLSHLGSGVVMSYGAIATNCHVIKGATTLVVRYQGREYAGEKQYTDWDRDTCMLTAKDLKAPPVRLGTTRELRIGARVYAIGAPQGIELTLSEGIVSNLLEVAGGKYIQVTAQISAGSSGGGLFDEEGYLLGLTTFYLSEGQNLNFAVPVEWVKELPKRHKEITQGIIPTIDRINRVFELIDKQNWPGVIEYAQRWIAAEPENGWVWVSLGLAYDNSDETGKAIDAYQQALRINPELSIAWEFLGGAYEKQGQHKKAIETLQQALRIDARSSKAWFNLGTAYANFGQIAHAIEAYQECLRIDQKNMEVWIRLGMTYSVNGQSKKAIETLQQSLRINPTHVEAWYCLGIAYKFDGQYKPVFEVYQRLKALDSKRSEEFFNKVLLPR